MKKCLSLILAAMLLLACLPTLALAEEPIEIELWTFFGGNDGTYMSNQVDAFNASQNKYHINVTTQDFATYYIKLKAAISGNEAPDFCTSHDDYVWGLVKEGYLEPIDAACDRLGVNIQFDNYIEKLDMLRYNGTVYAVPLDGVLRILHYNKEICQAAGLLNEDGTLKLEDGMDGWVAAMEAVKAAGYNPFITRETGSHPVYLFNALYYQFGGTQPWISDDGTTVTLEKDACIAALEAYRTICSYNMEGVSNTGEVFLAGETAFTYDQSASANTFYTGLGDKYGAQPTPTWGKVRKTAVFSHTFVLPVNAKRTDEKTAGCLEFIKWFGENNMGWAACGHMPAYKPVRDSEEFKASKLHALYADSVNMPTDSLSYGAPIAMKGSSELNDPLYLVGRGELTPEEGYEQIYNNLTMLLADYQ